MSARGVRSTLHLSMMTSLFFFEEIPRESSSADDPEEFSRSMTSQRLPSSSTMTRLWFSFKLEVSR
jgi:hypothetical protein